MNPCAAGRVRSCILQVLIQAGAVNFLVDIMRSSAVSRAAECMGMSPAGRAREGTLQVLIQAGAVDPLVDIMRSSAVRRWGANDIDGHTQLVGQPAASVR